MNVTAYRARVLYVAACVILVGLQFAYAKTIFLNVSEIFAAPYNTHDRIVKIELRSISTILTQIVSRDRVSRKILSMTRNRVI